MKHTGKRLALAVAVMAVWLFASAALADQDGFCDAVPETIKADVRGDFGLCTLEDYIEIPVPGETWGFALLCDQTGTRRLLAYDVEAGRRKFATEKAAPQGAGTAFFVRASGDNEVAFLNAPDDLGFQIVYNPPDHEGYWYRTAEYHWQEGAFQLVRLSSVGRYFVQEDGLWRLEDMNAGVSGEPFSAQLATALPEVDLEAALTNLALGGAPEPTGVFAAQTVAFEKGRKYPVYTGPGEAYARSGDGKGSVSTNDWIEVFGQAHGYILIQYAVSGERCRVGWIEASALPASTQVRRLDDVLDGALEGAESVRTLAQACELTDDPFVSQTAIASLPEGTAVQLIMGDDVWAYVSARVQGETMLGFVPAFYVEE